MRPYYELTALWFTLVSCGASVSNETRTAYSIEVAHCAAREREIVDRTGTTREQDEHDLATERARCDAATHAIEVADHVP